MMNTKILFGILLILTVTPASCEIATMGPYTLTFDAPEDLSQGKYDKTIAMEDETLYAYSFGNQDVSRVCIFYLHDSLVPQEFEWMNKTLGLWLGYGTVRVRTWSTNMNDIISYRGDGITKEGALHAYGFARAFNVSQDGSGVYMYVVTKTVGLTKDEAEDVFSTILVSK